MADLTPARRAAMPQSDFAMAGKRFPMPDKEHARLALGGATRSEHAGNISAGTEDRIKAEARAKLGKPAIATHHALSIGGAHHMLKAGHITPAQHGHIVKSARAGLASGKKGKPIAAFGSLAPAPPEQDAQ